MFITAGQAPPAISAISAGGGAVSVPADYSELGVLLITVSAIGLLLPLAAIALVKATPLRSA